MQKVLVVDDEKEVTLGLQKVLRENGFEAIAAYDGEEGLAKAIKERPQLILLDIMMPKKDGFAMLEELRRHEYGHTIPVVVLSAKEESSSLLRCEELGSVDYIIKPYTIHEVLEVVKRYI